MTERALANKLRVKLIEIISEVDLPGFLFDEIDQSLHELNYFKLSNLYANQDTYLTYLEEIQAAYVDFIKTHNPIMRSRGLALSSYESFMTEGLYQQNYRFYFNANELVKIKSLFSVNCILRMKEFINRRILQKKVNLAKKSATKKS